MHALTLEVDASAAEAVCDALSDELGALCLSLEDADAGTPDEQPVFDEPGEPRAAWRRARICAHFDDADAALAAATAVAARPGGTVRVRAIAPLDERDWVRLSQGQFGPVAIDAGFWIVPTWSEVPAAATRSIRLDPGLAFGTGTHPTTRMCLRWLAARAEALVRPGCRVLDYGCGSGILAIAAGLFGATDVDAVDVDPAAIEATRANAAANGIRLRAGPPELAGGRYDVVVANILATPLKLLAPLLSARLGPGGELVLAGILERQAAELQAAYRPGLALDVADRDDGWILMTARAEPGSRVA